MDEFLCFKEKGPLYVYNEKDLNYFMDSTGPYIVKAEYAGDVRLNIWFSDGTTQSVDFRPFILSHPHPQYNRYIEPKYFKKFRLEHGNVVWGKNWDLVFPLEQLYSGKII